MMMPLLSQSMDLETQLSPLGTILKDVRAHYSPNREDRAEPCVKFCELTAAIQKPATCSTGRLGQHVAIDIGTGIDIGMAMDGYRNRCITTNTVIDMEDRERESPKQPHTFSLLFYTRSCLENFRNLGFIFSLRI